MMLTTLNQRVQGSSPCAPTIMAAQNQRLKRNKAAVVFACRMSFALFTRNSHGVDRAEIGAGGAAIFQFLLRRHHVVGTVDPNHVDQVGLEPERGLELHRGVQDDGVVCYLRKPVNDEHLIRCLRVALRSGERPKEHS
jgi:hypothetical protein